MAKNVKGEKSEEAVKNSLAGTHKEGGRSSIWKKLEAAAPQQKKLKKEGR